MRRCFEYSSLVRHWQLHPLAYLDQSWCLDLLRQSDAWRLRNPLTATESHRAGPTLRPIRPKADSNQPPTTAVRALEEFLETRRPSALFSGECWLISCLRFATGPGWFFSQRAQTPSKTPLKLTEAGPFPIKPPKSKSGNQHVSNTGIGYSLLVLLQLDQFGSFEPSGIPKMELRIQHWLERKLIRDDCCLKNCFIILTNAHRHPGSSSQG